MQYKNNWINYRTLLLGPKVGAECLTLLLRIREAPGSNLRPETDYNIVTILTEIFRGFPKSLHANAGILP
jgi:hypothetical protein